MLLSVDWDAFSGTRELVFDAPIWGTRDREYDRLDAWQERARKRGGNDWEVLAEDFPLYPGWEGLKQYAGVPTWVTLSHADAWAWLELFPVQDVLNIDSHHDLGNLRGDPQRVRPGNWAGLALQAGKIRSYTCQYPEWHVGLPVAEGFDLARTSAELQALLSPALLPKVNLTRADGCPDDGWPDPAGVQGVLLVQSPAWTNPAHDTVLNELADHLRASSLAPLMTRSTFKK